MRVLVVVNKTNPGAVDASLLLSAYLASQGIEYELIDSFTLPALVSFDAKAPIDKRLSEEPDMAIVLGGDGTILRTARFVSCVDTPILGINFGHLGFLANSSEAGVVAIVAAALSGDVMAQRRTNLRVDVVCEGDEDSADFSNSDFDTFNNDFKTLNDDLDDGDVFDRCDVSATGFRSFFALNEVAVARGASGRIVDFSIDVSGDRVATMRGDGVVVSTATGSTAYALSAGGPLVAPGYRGLVVVPLAPHTLQSRAMVTEQNDIVEIGLAGAESRSEASIFVDGEAASFEQPIERVIVRRGERPTTLLKYREESFYAQAARVFF